MKRILCITLLTPVLAIGADCETVTYQQSPVPHVSKPRRVGPATGVPVIRRKAVPAKKVLAPRVVRVARRFDCPPPSSVPPGHFTIPGVPFIGTPPVWGYPYPMPEPTGPQPIWPGTPNDFPPALTIPPGIYSPPGDFIPPRPNDVPEPPTLSIFLFGLALIVARRYMKWPTSSRAADAVEKR